MNIEIANRLVNLRKENSLSQEALAGKLGISRQAVSKWERAEASPDTDNLILLARLYGVSIDSLLQSDEVPVVEKEEVPVVEKEEVEADFFNQKDKNGRDEYVHVGWNGIHVREKDGSEVHVGWNGIHVREEDGSKVHVSWKGIHATDIEKGNNSYDEVHDINEETCDNVVDVWENIYSDIKDSNSGGSQETSRNTKDVRISKEGVFVNGEEYCGGDWNWCGEWSDHKRSFPFDTFIIIGYLITSICFNTWHPGWLIFFVIPLGHSLRVAVKKKNPHLFAYPVLMLLVFLMLAIFKGTWHPSWAVFLTIPIYYSLVSYIRDNRKSKEVDNEKSN